MPIQAEPTYTDYGISRVWRVTKWLLNRALSITNAITAALTEIERARGFLDAATLTDEWVDCDAFAKRFC